MPESPSPSKSPKSRAKIAAKQVLIERLHRCFVYISNFDEKETINEQLKPLQTRLATLEHCKNNDGLVTSVSSISMDHHEMSEEEIDKEMEELKKKRIKLNGMMFEIQSRRGQTISKQDIHRLLTVALHYKPTESEVDRIVFEVDDTMDNKINWEEFQLAYLRNVKDKTGLEPNNLHNIITFCMYHAEGRISVAEALDCLKRERNYTTDQANAAIESVLGTYHNYANRNNQYNHDGMENSNNNNNERNENDQKPTAEELELAKQRFKELQVTYKQYKEMAAKRYNTRNVLVPKNIGGRMEMVQKKESKELDLPYLRKKGKGLAAISSIHEVSETEKEPSRKSHRR